MTQPQGAPTTTPAPPAGDPGSLIGVTPPGTPQQIYRALRSQRDILGEQLGTAQRLRSNLVNQLAEQRNNDAVRVGIEKRIANVDARIAEIDKQIATSDQAVANAAAIPGATYEPPRPPNRTDPADVVGALGAVFMFVVMLPLAIAYARRIWRRSAKAEVRLPPEMSERMESLERGVEAIALEVERIGEGQRFVTQALAERLEPRNLNAGAAQPAYLRPGEKVEQRR